MARALAIPAQRLYRTTLLYKVAMAISGLVLLGFVLGHMLGNLQVFLGPEAINSYAAMLKSMPALLWGARIGLLVALIVHVTSAIKLVMLNDSARPQGYAVKKNKRSTFASRTMRWSGPLISLYIIYHLLHFTIGASFVQGDHVFSQTNVYANVIAGFSSPLVALVYIVANTALGIHLWHGAWALFQSLGLSHPKYDPMRRTFATAFSVLVTVGFVSVPLAVLFGIVN